MVKTQLLFEQPQRVATNSNGTVEPEFSWLLISMDKLIPTRLCVPLRIILDGHTYQLHLSNSEIKMADSRDVAAKIGSRVVASFILRQTETVAKPKPYLLGEAINDDNLRFISTLGNIIFGSGSADLVFMNIESDKPKPIWLDGLIRGQTNLSFQITRTAIDRIMIANGNRRLPLSTCFKITENRYRC